MCELVRCLEINTYVPDYQGLIAKHTTSDDSQAWSAWWVEHPDDLAESRRYLEAQNSLFRSLKVMMDAGADSGSKGVGSLMTRWESTLDRLAEDPMQLGRELDWVIKRQLIENYMAKHDLEWNDSRVQMIDLQFHDIRPGKGLFYKLEESDAVDRIATDDEIAKAIYDPPKDTRAYFRGMCLQRYADEIVSASWDSVIFDLKEGPLKKIFMLEPLRGTEAHVRQLLTESPTAADLLRNISRASGM